MTLPVAYAIYGIDSGGKHFIYEVKMTKDAPDGPENWKSDDGGWGDYWAGNSALEVIKEGVTDSQRWQEVVRRVGYRETGTSDGPIWTLDLPTPPRSGNTDENFVAKINAALAPTGAAPHD